MAARLSPLLLRRPTPMNYIRNIFTYPQRPRTMATNTVKNYIDSNTVVIFTKTWCGYCAEAKKTLKELNVEFTDVELDLRDDGDELQDALQEISGQRSVPNIFIGHKHIGGNSDLQARKRSGELVKVLKESGAL